MKKILSLLLMLTLMLSASAIQLYRSISFLVAVVSCWKCFKPVSRKGFKYFQQRKIRLYDLSSYPI